MNLLLRHVPEGANVLQVDCGPGVLASRVCTERKAQVWATDLSHEAAARAHSKGLRVVHADSDGAWLPFQSDSFAVVLSDSVIEHRVAFEHIFGELARVLRSGGRLILCLPNAAHWRCRWWLLTGHFPYRTNTPTDWLHLRFFTLPQLRVLLAEHGIVIQQVDGSASLWVRGLYPDLFRPAAGARAGGWKPVAEIYERLVHLWPTLLARDLIIVGVKREP